MSCSSALYSVNDVKTDLEAESKIPFGNTIRRFGKCLMQNDQGIGLTDRGYYSITCSITVEPDEAGLVQAQLFIDDSPIPGGTASSTASVAKEPVNISITSLVRIFEQNTEKLLTGRLLATGTVTNVSTVVVKV